MLKDRQRMPENTLVNSEFFGVQAVELPRQDSKWVSSMQQINQCFGYKGVVIVYHCQMLDSFW